MENDYGFPIGTKVTVKEAFRFTATVVGHTTNCRNQPLVKVHDDVDTDRPDSSLVYYPEELEIIK